MSRGLTSPQLAAISGTHRQVVPLIDAAFDSGTVYFALAALDVIYGGNTYIHAGPLATVQAVGEDASSIQGLQITLAGLDSSAIAIATAEPYVGRVIRLLKAYLDADTNEVVGEPKVQFIGRMRSMQISDDNTSSTIAVSAEHYDVELGYARPIRYTNADQRRFYADDAGCEWVTRTATATFIWPSKEIQGG